MTVQQLSEMEKAAIVLMLCAPSSLNLAWARHHDEAEVKEIMKKLSLKEDAKQAVLSTMREIQGADLAAFDAVAQVIKKKGFWPQEPHPTPAVANQIIKAPPV